MPIPHEYEGREQTYIKHEVLRRYLEKWALKLGKVARYGGGRLWYVDCFAGPWRSENERHADTSVAIGLDALTKAREAWEARGVVLSASALFVEKDAKAYGELEKFVSENKGPIDARTIHGEFGKNVARISQHLGNDPAFVFVDPTGWNGAAMSYIAPLVRPRNRDVLINLMYEHIRRFQGEEERSWLRKQISEFFGIPDNEMLRGTTEEELLRLYRSKLKERASLKHALDLAVPFSERRRTYFHLVVGGHHREVVRLFREIEHDVLLQVVPQVSEGVRRRRDADVGQQVMPFAGASTNPAFEERRSRGKDAARQLVMDRLRTGPKRYRALWPDVLEACPLRDRDLKELMRDMTHERLIEWRGRKPRQQTIQDDHVLALAAP